MSHQPQHYRFHELLQQVRQGSHEAARELYDQYLTHVIRGVRKRLWSRMRSKYDSQDFAQQVWASFFDDRDQLPDFPTPEALVTYLKNMAMNKVLTETRQLRAQRRDVQQERCFERTAAVGRLPASRDPTPSAEAAYNEQYDRLVEQQPALIKQVVELRLCGKTYDEIAAELNVDESTARHAINRLRSARQVENATHNR
jgi:RNA polymerase sigma factor (sigma-70 family)